MASNGATAVEDADMADCDGQKVVTMMDVLQEQQDFEDDANAVLGASDDKNCTYSRGYVKRQALYACLTCCPEAKNDPTKRAGVCLACSLHCHESHELVELYTKRNFRCDCGNPKFNSHPCTFTPNKTDLNYENRYNQNFSGVYCTCHRPYPDPEATSEEEMIQCIVCEDWLHANHLEATVPLNDQYSEMICKDCMEDNDFLHDYTDIVINTADKEIVITDPDLDVTGFEPVLNGSSKVSDSSEHKDETENGPKKLDKTEPKETDNVSDKEESSKTEEQTKNEADIDMSVPKPDNKEEDKNETCNEVKTGFESTENKEEIKPDSLEEAEKPANATTGEGEPKTEISLDKELDEATKERIEEEKLLQDEEDTVKTDTQGAESNVAAEKPNDSDKEKHEDQTTTGISSEKTKKDQAETSLNDESECKTDEKPATAVEKVETQTEMNGDKKIESNSDNSLTTNEKPEDLATESQDNKRKLSNEDMEERKTSKKPKLEQNCVKPKGVKRLYKGATFWPSNFRQKLCTCSECISMYKDLAVLFLIDSEDTVTAYEALGKEQMDPASQYEKGLAALSSLDRIQQINALTEYNRMRDKLLDFLKSFKDRKEIVKEEDIKAFFAGMKPKRESDGVYFCR